MASAPRVVPYPWNLPFTGGELRRALSVSLKDGFPAAAAAAATATAATTPPPRHSTFLVDGEPVAHTTLEAGAPTAAAAAAAEEHCCCCPLCRREVPDDPTERGRAWMTCCGGWICRGCETRRLRAVMQQQRDPSGSRRLSEQACPVCHADPSLATPEKQLDQLLMFGRPWGASWAQLRVGDRLISQTPPLYKQAAAQYDRAASAGHPEAMSRLARMYAEGLGVPRDPERARKWEVRAREAGHEKGWARPRLAAGAYTLGLLQSVSR